jgi:hypothetical protein
MRNNNTNHEGHETMSNKFNINEIVKGRVAGTFVVLGFRTIDREDYAQVKPYNPATNKSDRGEFALPLTAIVKA